jgi:hypothetical protein
MCAVTRVSMRSRGGPEEHPLGRPALGLGDHYCIITLHYYPTPSITSGYLADVDWVPAAKIMESAPGMFSIPDV